MKKLIFLLLATLVPLTAFAIDVGPAEVTLGERLFSDFRFSQYFSFQSQGDANHELASGDPQLDYIKLLENKSKHISPFQGQAMACATCHMVDQAKVSASLRVRLYADYANFSPVPLRTNDFNFQTLRNSQVILPLEPNDPETPEFFHWDGEFNSLEELVKGGLAGRNMGWQITEKNLALENIAGVIRNDDGNGFTARAFGGYTYAELFLSVDPLIKEELRLPEQFRLNVRTASDQQIIEHVAQLVTIFLRNIQLQKNTSDLFMGSPYDIFLQKNLLPQKPNDGESALEYSQRLLKLIKSNESLQFVTEKDGHFESHDQSFKFGKAELAGLQLFFSLPTRGQHRPSGACVQCHTPPNFTDSRFHNIGISQLQYERENGTDSFKKLVIPSLTERDSQKDLYGLPIESSPNRLKVLRSQPNARDPRKADLGLWNLFANSDVSYLQEDLKTVIAQSLPEYAIANMTDAQILPLTIGMTKTPTLRNLGHSEPYFHDGHAHSLEMAVSAYVALGMGSRHGSIDPVDPKIKNIHMHAQHTKFLISFLKSLNEDYE